MSLCSCQLPHRQWRGVSWDNRGAQGGCSEVGKVLCNSSSEQRDQSCYTEFSCLAVFSFCCTLSYHLVLSCKSFYYSSGGADSHAVDLIKCTFLF